jgi:hypothetical protein
MPPLRLLLALVLVARAVGFHARPPFVAAPRRAQPSFGASRLRLARPPRPSVRMRLSDDDRQREEDLREFWGSRADLTRGTFRAIVDFKEAEREQLAERESRREDGTSGGDATKSAVGASAAAVVVGALVIRLGGRAALVGALGHDDAVAAPGIRGGYSYYFVFLEGHHA